MRSYAITMAVLAFGCAQNASVPAQPETIEKSSVMTSDSTSARADDSILAEIDFASLETLPATKAQSVAAIVPPILRVRVPGPPRHGERTLVHLTGRLENPSSEAVEVVYFPVHDRTPFYLDAVSSADITAKPADGPPRPPVPPRARVFRVPSETAVLFDETLDFDNYDVRSFENIQLQWTFAYWADPDPTGLVELPNDVAASLAQATAKLQPRRINKQQALELAAAVDSLGTWIEVTRKGGNWHISASSKSAKAPVYFVIDTTGKILYANLDSDAEPVPSKYLMPSTARYTVQRQGDVFVWND